MKRALIPLLLLLFTLAACTPLGPAPTAADTSSPVPSPSDTPDLPNPATNVPATEAPVPEASPTEAPFVLPEFTPFPRADAGFLVLDGFFEDWAAFDPIYTDPAGDGGFSGVDFTEIYAAHDDTHLFLKVSLGRVVDLESEPALELTIVQGERVISYNFGERVGRLDGASVRQEDLDLISLPTMTSDEFEIAFPFDPAIEGDIQILISDPNDGGDLASVDGEYLVYQWENFVVAPPPLSITKPENSLRIVTWNVLFDNIFDRDLEPHFARVLQALQPDVIHLQEIYTWSDKTALNHITEWLGGTWYAKQQGDLVTVSRFPFIENWKDGNYNLRARIFPALLDVNGTPLLVINAHLSCCDRDLERQEEVDSLIGFLRQVAIPQGLPFVLAGDLNLVGDAQQLVTLLTGDIITEDKFGGDHAPDWDGSLADLLPRHSHSRFVVTWRDDNSSFSPGRLDFVIYTDSVINAQGFVLDTSEMSQDVLDAYGLQLEDTDEASNHLPVVADIVIVSNP